MKREKFEKRQMSWRDQIITIDVFYETSSVDPIRTAFQVKVATDLLFDESGIIRRLPRFLMLLFKRMPGADVHSDVLLTGTTPIRVEIFRANIFHVVFYARQPIGKYLVIKIDVSKKDSNGNTSIDVVGIADEIPEPKFKGALTCQISTGAAMKR